MINHTPEMTYELRTLDQAEIEAVSGGFVCGGLCIAGVAFGAGLLFGSGVAVGYVAARNTSAK
jgi:lactobin A/cerein 7B family class IIb bacteriocin